MGRMNSSSSPPHFLHYRVRIGESEDCHCSHPSATELESENKAVGRVDDGSRVLTDVLLAKNDSRFYLFHCSFVTRLFLTLIAFSVA